MFHRYDTVHTRKLQYIAQFAPSIDECQSHVKALRRYLSKSKACAGGVSTVRVDYDIIHERQVATDGLSVQCMPRPIRNFLAPDNTVDIDIANSAPTVLAQLCRRHGVETPCLDAFLPVYRDRCKEIGSDYSRVKGQIFFSSADIQMADAPGWLRALTTEVREVIFPALSSVNEYSGIFRQAERADREKRDSSSKRQRRGAGGYSENIQGIFLSHLYFHYETRILKVLEEAGKEYGYWDDHISLIYDGVMVVKRPGSVPDLRRLETAVKEGVGIDIKLAFKSVQTTLKLDINRLPDRLVVVDGDEEASNLVNLALDGQVLRCEDSVFVKHDGVWTDNTSLVDDFLLAKVCAMDIKQLKEYASGETKEVNFSVNVSDAKGIVRLARTKFPNRPEFVRELVLGSLCKLAFENGYWMFTEIPEDGVYGRFVHGGSFDTGVRINSMFPARNQDDMDFVMHHLIKAPFDNTPEGTMELFLLALARALAGHMDKITNIMVGGRDSSKSVLMQFIRNALGRYACTIPSGIFAIRGGSMSDAYRDGAWIFDAEFARIGAISEATQMTTGETIFSGDTLKKFQSCKEGMSARKIRQNQREAYSLVTGFMLLNDIPRFEPADAIEKCHIYAFPNQFVSEEVKAANPFNSKFKIADARVEDWVRDPKYHAALLWILFEAYKPTRVVPNESMIESAEQLMDETGLAMYDRLLDITLDPEDKEEQSRILKALKTACPGIGHARISRELQAIMDDRCRVAGKEQFSVKCYIGNGHGGGRRMGYRGIKIRSEQGHFDGGGYADGFMP